MTLSEKRYIRNFFTQKSILKHLFSLIATGIIAFYIKRADF